jgi:hypothetical protein
MGGGSTTAKTASYVLVAADAGTTVAMNAAGSTTITVNTSLFSEGDTVTIQNRGAGVCTITAGTATVTTSGSLVLAQYEGGVLYFNSASSATFYQFATPASGDIEGVTAGTGISGGGTSGTVTITNSMATTIDAKGDLIVGTGADTFARLPVGSNTYTLVADSSTATGLAWSAPAGGGKVLQVVTAFKDDTFSASDSAYQDITGLSVSITPSSTSSKVLVMMTVTGSHQPTIADAVLRLVRGATAIGVAASAGNRTLATVSLMAESTTCTDSTAFTYLDSPATTSSTTYKVQGTGNGSTPKGFFINRGSLDTDVVSVARTASSITVMEIGA